MLEGLDAISWEDLEKTHGCFTAYGSITEIPKFLRQLLSRDPEVRSYALERLCEYLLHQGTRVRGTSYVIPFIIELCGEPSVGDRSSLLCFWSYAIANYLSIQERPTWDDGKTIYSYEEVDNWSMERDTTGQELDRQELHRIYRESLKGEELLGKLLDDDNSSIREGAVCVLACMPTLAKSSVPKLAARFEQEKINRIRGGIAFALGELGASSTLEKILTTDECLATRCIAACQLARIAPQDNLIEPLLEFVRQPIDDYQDILGAGVKSTDDAAFAIACFVETLLSTAFEKRERSLTKLTDIQKLVLSRILTIDELWSMENLKEIFFTYGLFDVLSNRKRQEFCAELAGIELTADNALRELRHGLALAEMNFLPQARESILKAFEMDSRVFERVPTPEEAWLLYAKAFAASDSQRSLAAYRNAYLIDWAIANQIDSSWYLANLLEEADF